MCAMTLCSACPTSRGRTRKAASTEAARTATSRTVIADPTPAGGTPGAWTRRRLGDFGGLVALAGLLAAGPRLRRPRGELEGLAQGRALEAVRQQQRADREPAAVVEPGEVDAEHLERLALVPGGTGIHAGDRVDGVAVGDAGDDEDAAQRAWPADVEQVRGDVEPGCRLVVGAVDRAQPVEEGVAVVARGGDSGTPLAGLDHARLVSHLGSLSTSRRRGRVT